MRGGGGQAYSRLSTTHRLQVGFGGGCRCMHGELMWTWFVWAEGSTPDTFGVPSHRFNSATGEQEWITQTIYTDSEPPSRLSNSLMPSAKLRNANLPVLRLCCDAVGDRTPSSPTPTERSNHYATRGQSPIDGQKVWLGVRRRSKM